MMQIQINTDRNIEGHDALTDEIAGVVENALSRFRNHITRVEVHVSDENSDKKVGYEAMRCLMEARLEGRQPIAVTHQARSLGEAVDGAADKLAGVIENTLGRLRDQERRMTAPVDSAPAEPKPEKES
ncbi:MAG: HPF/RaiA family ribosome-associated protein [Acidobacteriota bacterium]|nr:HPF/RaiA family ribosome-associated protein [Acidobacteriota bacterium]